MTGLLALATGLAYTTLGVITVYELIRYRRDRGFSHFGLSFAVMAFTCGPHHLVHAYRHLVAHEPAHGPMLAAMALGAAPAVVFIALRLEATFGGRGDRMIRNSRIFVDGAVGDGGGRGSDAVVDLEPRRGDATSTCAR